MYLSARSEAESWTKFLKDKCISLIVQKQKELDEVPQGEMYLSARRSEAEITGRSSSRRNVSLCPFRSRNIWTKFLKEKCISLPIQKQRELDV
ncbi:hypothetical protein AVEN_175698-1 [Araneus ventricosus]|uniref:Uncharacterized protein n=1 Tax=Araneus ventricosus TaxID=182803 RepID=A0A4Y2LGS1_ARAVE|nr:hypothetical protein AVEN_175698-1 [Araneus ventricosus]